MNKILALKYRPKLFNEVIGQDFCIKSLSNSIKLNKLHNAYLFSGTRGVGKTTIARIFAKSLLCREGISESPCGKCESCLGIDSNNNLDLIEIDAASRTKVEDTRALMENVQYAPTASRFKIYLIDEVHMLSTKSFNALLKTIEEPPDHVKFLLATTEPDKLPETVISRCLHFKLETITKNVLSHNISETLKKENISFETKVPSIIADAAKGSARDSMSILEQCISYGNGNLTNSEISQLLGVIDEHIVDDIISNLYNNDISNIQTIFNDMKISNYTKLLDCLIERVFQISIAHTTNKSNTNIPEHFLVTTIKLEDLQLWYSILLQAKNDFDNAISKPDHLLMILLRISLFTDYTNNPNGQTLTHESVHDKPSKKKDNQITPKIDKKIKITFQKWKDFVHSQNLTGLILDLAQNSIIEIKGDSAFLVIDKSKENTYPQKCIKDFTKIVCKNFMITGEINIEYLEQSLTIYKESINNNIKSKEDMYDSIKDNVVVKEIETVFDAKIDKDNISKL